MGATGPNSARRGRIGPGLEPDHAPPATDHIYDSAFALKDGTNLVIVGRSMYGNRDRPFYKLVRSVGVQVVWKAVDIWLGVPVSILLNPPTNLVDAFFYAADLHEI